MTDVREYLDRQGRNRYKVWFDRLSPQAAAKVATALTRLALGNGSNVKGVGSGVFELKIDFGPGYRVYSERTASTSSFCSVAASKSASSAISPPRSPTGRVTNGENRRSRHASDPRL